MARSTCAVRSRAILRHLQPRGAGAASSAAAVRKPLPDPHNVSHSLDAETSARIIGRLESRGKDEIFRSLFLDYFPELSGRQNVLEIGCGTVQMRSSACHLSHSHVQPLRTLNY